MDELPPDLRRVIEGNPIAKALFDKLPDELKNLVSDTEETIVSAMRADYADRSHDELVEIAIDATKTAGRLRADLLFAQEALEQAKREDCAGNYFWACYLSTLPTQEVRLSEEVLDAFNGGCDLLVETNNHTSMMRARLVRHGGPL